MASRMQAKMMYDYHTHTIYSKGMFGRHAKGTIEENVIVARAKGLKAIAVSDHGPGHIFYGLKTDKLSIMRAEIDRLNAKYDDIDIYLSVEADIIESENGLDLPQEMFNRFDFVLAGYHFGTFHSHSIANWIADRGLNCNRIKDRMADKNTAMVLKALFSNKIKVLTHPGEKAPVHMGEVARACAETGTLMEISAWHPHLTVDEIKTAAKENVKFIISSDAHTPEMVGTFKGGIERARMAGLDLERIVNIWK